MAYRLRKSEAAGAGVRRIAVEEIDKAIDRLEGGADAEAVHEVRKGCKRLRGLLRLVRPGLGDEVYQLENAAFRDIARELAEARDADAVLEALDALAEREPDALDYQAVANALRSSAPAGPGAGADRALADFRAARLRVSDWRLDGRGFDVVGPGLAKTYGRGRDRYREAYQTPSVEALHEWRKRVKYHWYHVRLLEPMWPGPMGALRTELKRLSDLLGDDHDLAVMRTMLPPAGEALGAAEHARLLSLIDERRATLQADAFVLGARIYAEGAKRLQRRFHRYWHAWRGD